MAASPQPEIQGTSPANQTGGGDPASGAQPGGQPSQAPANPSQIMLAQMYQLCKRLSEQDPTLAPGLAKAAQGIQEAQTAMVTQPQPPPTGANPPQ
jgi:hypothetical protein